MDENANATGRSNGGDAKLRTQMAHRYTNNWQINGESHVEFNGNLHNGFCETTDLPVHPVSHQLKNINKSLNAVGVCTDISNDWDAEHVKKKRSLSVDSYTEASEMLANALEQIDDLLSGTTSSVDSFQQPQQLTNGYIADEESVTSSSGVLSQPVSSMNDHYEMSKVTANNDNHNQMSVEQILGLLVDTLKLNNSTTSGGRPIANGHATVSHNGKLWKDLHVDERLLLTRWLSDQIKQSPSPSTSTVSCPEYGVEYDSILQRLEVDRENLALQVSVLHEQVGAQGDKIKDLQVELTEKSSKLDSTEEILQEELLARTNLETSKLDLMSEISNLKIKYAGLEKEKFETLQKLRNVEAELNHLRRILQQRDQEIASSKNATSILETAEELDQLRSEMQQLLLINHKKDAEIDDMRRSLLDQQHRINQQRNMIDEYGSAVNSPRHKNSNSSNASYNAHPQYGRHDINDALRNILMQAESAPSAGAPPGAFTISNSSSFADSSFGYSTGGSASGTTTRGSGGQPQGLQQQQQTQQQQQQQQQLGMSTSMHSYLSSMQSSNSCTSGLSSGISSHLTPPPYMIPPQPLQQQQQQQPHSGASSNTSSTLSQNYVAPGGFATPRHRLHERSGNSSVSGSNLTDPLSQSSPQAQQLAAELSQLVDDMRYQKNPPYYPTSSQLKGKPPKSPGSLRRLQAASGGTDQSAQYQQYNQNIPNSYSMSFGGKSAKGSSSSSQPKGWLKGWLLRKSLKANKRSTSAPNLGDPFVATRSRSLGRLHTTTSESESESLSTQQPTDTKGTSSLKRGDRKHRSLRRLIGKMKRSNSQEIDHDLGDGSTFRRGVSARATTGRIGFNSLEFSRARIPTRPRIEVFSLWSSDQICDWLVEIGLGQYSFECRKCIRSGRHLINCTQSDLERELGIKSSLHRKKLMLALRSIEQGHGDLSNRMDTHQVQRWLDDIGLPQFREPFAESRIDGTMLVELTVDDLMQMKIQSAIHHACLARGIEVLKQIQFDPSQLIRNYVPEHTQKPCPNRVKLWTQHCVSQWLKSIDLAEFTPRLMGAGIHGALIVLEPLFTSESLAVLLDIPSKKTLLRRHLATHFNELLGKEIIGQKRELLLQFPYMQELLPTLIVKPLKKGFSLSRKKGDEVYAEPDALICPKSIHAPQRLDDDMNIMAEEGSNDDITEITLDSIPASDV